MAVYQGLNFDNLRKALFYLYYGSGIDPTWTEEEQVAYELACYRYIIPMQQNFFNPIEELGNDTYIQYYIDKDSRLTQDSFGYKANVTQKVGDITLRFIGQQAEDWAKGFHHLTKRKDAASIFAGTCNGELLEAVGDIVSNNVDYFGKNVNIAFDLRFRLHYIEIVELNWQPLQAVSLAPGKIT